MDPICIRICKKKLKVNIIYNIFFILILYYKSCIIRLDIWTISIVPATVCPKDHVLDLYSRSLHKNNTSRKYNKIVMIKYDVRRSFTPPVQAS